MEASDEHRNDSRSGVKTLPGGRRATRDNSPGVAKADVSVHFSRSEMQDRKLYVAEQTSGKGRNAAVKGKSQFGLTEMQARL